MIAINKLMKCLNISNKNAACFRMKYIIPTSYLDVASAVNFKLSTIHYSTRQSRKHVFFIISKHCIVYIPSWPGQYLSVRSRKPSLPSYLLWELSFSTQLLLEMTRLWTLSWGPPNGTYLNSTLLLVRNL